MWSLYGLPGGQQSTGAAASAVVGLWGYHHVIKASSCNQADHAFTNEYMQGDINEIVDLNVLNAADAAEHSNVSYWLLDSHNTPHLLLCHPCPCCSFLFWIQSMRVYVVCRCSIVDAQIDSENVDSQAIHDWQFCYHCFKFQTNNYTQLIWPQKIFQRSNRIKYISMKKILLPLKVIGKVAICLSPPRSIGISVMHCIWLIWYMIDSHSWSSLLKYKEENLWEI